MKDQVADHCWLVQLQELISSILYHNRECFRCAFLASRKVTPSVSSLFSPPSTFQFSYWLLKLILYNLFRISLLFCCREYDLSQFSRHNAFVFANVINAKRYAICIVKPNSSDQSAGVEIPIISCSISDACVVGTA